MNPQYVYLGTWFQRTSLHLKEVYIFLKFKKGIVGLDQNYLELIWEKLKLKSVKLHEEESFDYVEFVSHDIRTIITEDGVVLMRMEFKNGADYHELENFYTEYLAPVLAHLFSLGAPLPKELKNVKEIYPHYFMGDKLTKENIVGLFGIDNDILLTEMQNDKMEIYVGENMTIVNYKKAGYSLDEREEFLRNLVFFREFEEQLNRYLNLHRLVWEKISDIRNKRSLRFYDFHHVREKILHFLKTLSFSKARLSQMGDILQERTNSTKIEMKKQLESLGINRFEFLKADQKYISHLCQMTIEYVDGTLKLIQSLYEESTQRELTTLKFVTFVGVLTGFFGMNIAFPWEERWSEVYKHSFSVVFIIISVAVLFYFFLKFFIYNRRFIVKEDQDKE